MFSVSAHARYALRALQYIARYPGKGYVPLSRIAEDEQISRKYLENIFTSLKRGGIVRSVRGPDGGYALARGPTEISLWDVMTAADGNIKTADCVDSPEVCERYDHCDYKDVWEELQNHIEDFLRSRTIENGSDESRSAGGTN